MSFRISARVLRKLEDKHGVSMAELRECFRNRRGNLFEDTRAGHATDPPSYWFIARTDRERPIKVVVVKYPEFLAVKSAFEPTDRSETLYEILCRKFPQ